MIKLTVKSVLFSVCLLLPALAMAADASEEIKRALMARHDVAPVGELQKIAGGESELVEILLELRQDNETPFVSVRAEKILLDFGGRDDVADALEADVNNPETVGLARVVLLHVNRIPSSDTRVRVARAGVRRARAEPKLRTAVSGLEKSSDPRVRAVAQGE